MNFGWLPYSCMQPCYCAMYFADLLDGFPGGSGLITSTVIPARRYWDDFWTSLCKWLVLFIIIIRVGAQDKEVMKLRYPCKATGGLSWGTKHFAYCIYRQVILLNDFHIVPATCNRTWYRVDLKMKIWQFSNQHNNAQVHIDSVLP